MKSEKKKRKATKRHTGRRATRARRTSERRRIFLATLRKGGSETAAAEAAGVSRRTPYKWREKSVKFAAEWDDAEQAGTDRLEDAGYKRAVYGTKRPIYQGGKLVGHEVQYSDPMTALLLKARRPEKYGTKLELSGSVATPTPRDFETEIGRARRVSYALAVGAFAKAEQERGKRLALPAPAPEPVYRDATPAAEVRAQHPSASAAEPQEKVINPRPGDRDSSGYVDGQRRYWNPAASAHEMGREE